MVPARAEHEWVKQQGVLVAKQLGEFYLLAYFPVGGPLEDIVLFQLPADRQLAAFFCHRFYFVDKLLFVLEQCVAGVAIFSAFVRIPEFTHVRLLSETNIWKLSRRGAHERPLITYRAVSFPTEAVVRTRRSKCLYLTTQRTTRHPSHPCLRQLMKHGPSYRPCRRRNAKWSWPRRGCPAGLNNWMSARRAQACGTPRPCGSRWDSGWKSRKRAGSWNRWRRGSRVWVGDKGKKLRSAQQLLQWWKSASCSECVIERPDAWQASLKGARARRQA